MALIKCPECGKEISDLSDVCVHCGFPIKKMVEADNKKIICSFNGEEIDIHELREYAVNDDKSINNPAIIMDIMIHQYDCNWGSTEKFATLCMRDEIPKVFNYRTITELKEMEKIVEQGNMICAIGEEDYDFAYLVPLVKSTDNYKKLEKELSENKKLSKNQAKKVIEFIRSNGTVPKAVDTSYQELDLLYEALPIHKTIVKAAQQLREDRKEYNADNLKSYLQLEKEKGKRICIINGQKWEIEDEFIRKLKENINNPVVISKMAKTFGENSGLTHNEATNFFIQIIKNDFIPPKEYNSSKENNIARCPKCGSTNIQMVNKKFSLLTGFATNKVDRVCVNCKYKW